MKDSRPERVWYHGKLLTAAYVRRISRERMRFVDKVLELNTRHPSQGLRNLLDKIHEDGLRPLNQLRKNPNEQDP